ncbi:MAG: hypothetical protein QM537_00755 [Candidatus Symbiobacter sp.]|nr:hypothetical protein [Candidatus Symbiobacter sp.]
MLNLNLDLGAETEARLVLLAQSHGQSVEDTVGGAIATLLSKSEPPREFRPNAETLESFAQYERGEYKSFNTIEELMADLNADD